MTKALLALFAVSTGLLANEWQIDTAHSAAQFAVRHLMVSTVRGHFGKITGKATYDAANPAKGSVEATVDVTTIDTREAKRDAHLKTPDFFDAANHPAMHFRSTKIEPAGEGKLKMTGDLTIRGTTKPVVFDVEISQPIKDQRGGERIGAAATAKINRRDFGINYGSAATVGNEVTITIDIEMVKR
jgi:polyisoprenoid-binding protein YceI